MSGYFVQGRHGTKGNFEVVIPASHGDGMMHLWRNNDDPAFPWSAPVCFGGGDVASACLVQGNFGATGNLEVVARVGESLVFYWRLDHAPWTWSGPFSLLASKAQGNPALIQSRHGSKGNFELVCPHKDGGMMHLWRNNDVASLPWSGPQRFGSGNITGVSLIQSNFGSPGNLELIAVQSNRLIFYWRMDHGPWTWSDPATIANAVRGVPSLIQGRHGSKGNFEVVVPHRDGGLIHLWRNNDSASLPWSAPLRFGSGLYEEVTVVQGNFGSPGNLEVVARRTDGMLDFYWRQDRAPWTWNGPFLIGRERSANVSECVYGWRSAFFQADTHIVVRLQLNPDAGISAATLDNLRTTWRNGIISKWSDRFDCKSPNGERRRITFDVQWVSSNAHHVVRVRPGPERSNMTTWDTLDTGDVASHEFGHMLGHVDEYADGTCPARSPVNTGTVMDDNTEVVERLMETFANFHCGHDAVPRPAPESAALPPAEVRRPPTSSVAPLRSEEIPGFVQRMRAADLGGDRAAAADERKVVLLVSGGPPSERLNYRAEVLRSGLGSMSLVDAISDRRQQATQLSLPMELVDQLFDRATAHEVLYDNHAMPPLLPDSLVGTIVITDGKREKRLHFPVATSTGRNREASDTDLQLLAAPGLQIRREYASPGIRSIVDTFQALPASMR